MSPFQSIRIFLLKDMLVIGVKKLQKISDAEKKIPNTSGLVKKTDLHAKITEIESKIPSITGLVTNSALTAVENIIPDVSSLVKKTDYDTKISDIEKKITDHNHDKYITTSEFNKLTTENFNARLAQGNLIIKTDFDSRLQSLSKRTISNKTKHLLVEIEFRKLEKFDAAYFRGKDRLEQNYLAFKPMNKYFKKIGDTKSIHVVYDLNSNLKIFDPALENCLFRAIKITKNIGIDKYQA